MTRSSLTLSIPVPGQRARWVAAGLAVGLIVALIAGPAFGPRSILATDPGAGTAEHTISVNGTGSVSVSPDVADIRLGVVSTAKTVKAARAANATAMAAVFAAFKGRGIADKDIQTTALNLSPTYDYSTNTNPPRLTGYTLSNIVSVTIRDLDIVGDAIDGALAAGANSLDSIAFRVADQTAAENRARTDAMTAAKAKAQVLATAAGVSITGVASISESMAPTPYPIFYGERAAALDDKTQIQPGTNDITVTVAVVYVIN